jgi:hypothetical protein
MLDKPYARRLKPIPPQDYLKECFEHLEDGQLIWKARPASHFATSRGHKTSLRCVGKNVGTKNIAGYLHVDMRWNGVSTDLLVHRIIWVIHHGPIPEGYLVDHEDTNKSNNRIDNLRLTLPVGNNQNVNRRLDNSSGVKGVSWDKSKNKWVVYISSNHTRLIVGLYNELEQATGAIIAARAELHGAFANHG